MSDQLETKQTTITSESPSSTVQTTKQSVQKGAVEPTSPQQAYQKKKVIYRTYQFVWYILGVVEVLLMFRVGLKMLGANAATGFVSFIYSVSDLFALPFAGIFGVTASNGAVLEWSTLIGMVVYIVVAYGVIQLLQLIKPTTPEEVEQVVDTQ